MIKTSVSLLLSLAVVAVSALYSGAASRLTEDLADLVKAAEAVVEVRVLSQQVQPQSNFGMPLTIIQVETLKSYKGELRAGAVLELETLGGATGTTQMIVPGQPQFANGARAVVLLACGNDGQRWRVVAGDAGQIMLGTDANRQLAAQRATGKFEYYISCPESLTGYTKMSSASVPRERLDQLLAALVATGRPVIDLPPQQAAAVHTELPPAAPSAQVDGHLFNLMAFLLVASLAFVVAKRAVRRLV